MREKNSLFEAERVDRSQGLWSDCGGRKVELACNLVNKGYWYYTAARIPADKNPMAVDEKLVERYGLELSKWARARRRASKS